MWRLWRYFAAWNETKTEQRRKLLESCWDSGAVFRDSMGEAAGLDGLLHYIERAQRFMPGVRVWKRPANRIWSAGSYGSRG